MNVEKAREAFHAAHESPFAVIEQLQMAHTIVCQTVKVPYQLQQAGWSLCVALSYCPCSCSK